jgi:hypothetical protein
MLVMAMESGDKAVRAKRIKSEPREEAIGLWIETNNSYEKRFA